MLTFWGLPAFGPCPPRCPLPAAAHTTTSFRRNLAAFLSRLENPPPDVVSPGLRRAARQRLEVCATSANTRRAKEIGTRFQADLNYRLELFFLRTVRLSFRVCSLVV